MSYTPPVYTDAGGNILTGYTPPAYTDAGGDVVGVLTLYPSSIAPIGFGTAVVSGTASFAPDAWESSAFGGPSIINFHSFVDPTGFTEEAFGDPLVLNWMQFAYPPSIASTLLFGTLDVSNYLQYIEPSGIAPDPDQVPEPTQVVDPLQFITGVGGIEAPAFPLTHYVADYYQFIDLNTYGPTSYAVSTPAIGHRVRTIEVPFIVNTYFGDTVVDNNDIRPSGIADGVVSNDASIELKTRFVAQHSSLRFTVFGTPGVQLLRQYVGARSVYEQDFGVQDVQNYIRYVYPGPYYTNSPPNVLGNFAWVKNRNVTLVANSFVSSKFGSYTAMSVRNKARGVAAEGINSLQFGTTDVSHRIRTLVFTGFDSFTSRHWHVVYNNAVVAAPAPISGSDVGRPVVYNRNRYLQPLTVGDGAAVGTAFIARRIRTLTQFNSYPHLTGYFGVPSVRYRIRPIAPIGFVPEYPLGVPRPNGLFGATLVRGPFIKTIAPRGLGPERFSNGAVVTNRNRVIRPPATTRRDEFGPFTRIENYTRYLPQAGWSSSRIGAHTVADRTRRLGPATLTLPGFPITHRVRNLLPDPPSVQYLFVVPWDEALVGNPSNPEVRFPTFYPAGWSSLIWGMPSVRGNEIKIERGVVDLDQLGVPWVRGTQFVHATGWISAAIPPMPRFTPYTIYAPEGDQATAQARANHPTINPPHVIGPEVFGYPEVMFKNRSLLASGETRTAYGVARIELHRRYVTPVQIKSLRMGLPVIQGTVQFINCNTRGSGFDASSLGAAAVTRVRSNPEYLFPVWSVVSVVSAQTEVSNFIRTISVDGIPHRGNPQEGYTSPWGLPEVYPPRHLYPEWFRSSVFGTHRVEHRIRNLYTEGFDSCSFNEEDIPTFNSRMRVKGRRIVHASSIVSAATVPQPVVT